MTMTPEQIELARKAMALPGFKVSGGLLFLAGPPPGMAPPMDVVLSSAPTHRIDDDVDDTLEMLQGLGWIPHLADPAGATDGALLKLFGPCEIRTGQNGCARVLFWHPCLPDELPGPVEWSSDRADYGPTEDQWESMVDGESVAETICRAAIALGRWPGGRCE